MPPRSLHTPAAKLSLNIQSICCRQGAVSLAASATLTMLQYRQHRDIACMRACINMAQGCVDRTPDIAPSQQQYQMQTSCTASEDSCNGGGHDLSPAEACQSAAAFWKRTCGRQTLCDLNRLQCLQEPGRKVHQLRCFPTCRMQFRSRWSSDTNNG